MSEENNASTTSDAQPVEKKKGFPLMLIILAVVLIWAVVAYFMALESDETTGHVTDSVESSEVATQQETAVAVDATDTGSAAESDSAAPTTATENAQEAVETASDAMQEAANTGADAMKQIMDVFAPAK